MKYGLKNLRSHIENIEIGGNVEGFETKKVLRYAYLAKKKKHFFLSVKIIYYKIFRWKKSIVLSKLTLYSWYFLIRYCAWD